MQPSIYKKIKPSVIFKKNRRVHEKSYIVRFFQWWYFVIWTVWMWGLYSMLNFSIPCWQKSFTCFVETYFQFVEIMLYFFHLDWLFCLIENDEICCKHAQCRCQGGFVHYEETKSIETTLLLDCLNKWFEGTIQIFFLDSVTLKVGLDRTFYRSGFWR